MKIAYVCQNVLWKDAKNIDIDILKMWNQEHELAVFTQKKGLGEGLQEESIEGIRCFLIDFKKRGQKQYLLDKLFKPFLGVRKFATDLHYLIRFLDTFDPDIVQVEGVWPWGVIAYYANQRTKKQYPIIITRHNTESFDSPPFTYHGRPDSWIRKKLSKKVYQNLYLRANSYLTKQWLIEEGAKEDNIFMVPVTISAKFTWNPSLSQKDHFRFISLSRLTPMKGLDVLIDAWKIVAHKYPKAHLDIFGFNESVPRMGDYQAFLQKRIDSHNLQNNVFLKDPIPRGEVTNVLGEYYFNIASSHGETLNVVAAEAASRAVPTIITEYCGIKDWILKYQAGMVCLCTPESLAESIIKAIEMDQNSYELMQQNCQNLHGEFVPEVISEQLIHTYKNIVLSYQGQITF